MPQRALHHVIVALFLFGFWVVLSGKLDVVHLSMGVASTLLVTWLSADLLYTNVDSEAGPQRRWLTSLPWLRIWAYLPWLGWEIVKANIQVLKLVLGPQRNLQPHIVALEPHLGSEVSRVVYANSITLTPGTVTLDITADGKFLVHAIDKPSGDGLVEGSMERKVAHTFKEKAAVE